MQHFKVFVSFQKLYAVMFKNKKKLSYFLYKNLRISIMGAKLLSSHKTQTVRIIRHIRPFSKILSE